MCITVGMILLILCDSVNRASQKQEFRQRDMETKTDTKQLALARLNYIASVACSINVRLVILGPSCIHSLTCMDYYA